MTTRPRIDRDSTSIPRMTAVIAATPGLSSRAIAAAAGYALSHTKNILSVLSRDGIAKPVPQGYQRGWYLAELADPLLAQWDRTRRKRWLSEPRGPTKRDKIAELSRADGGVSMSQIMAACGVELNAGGHHCVMMCRQGRLHRAMRGGCRIRWFDTAERAQAWQDMPPMVPSMWMLPRQKASKPLPHQTKRAKPAKAPLLPGNQLRLDKAAKPAPVIVKRQPVCVLQVVDYSRAKLTVYPSTRHDPRYQCDPAERMPGGFAAAGIGRYGVAA